MDTKNMPDPLVYLVYFLAICTLATIVILFPKTLIVAGPIQIIIIIRWIAYYTRHKKKK